MENHKKEMHSETEKAESPKNEGRRGTELFAYAGTVVTILSTLLWTAGYSFNAGYWDEANLPNSYIVNTIQETMFWGVQASKTWMAMLFILIAFGLIFFVFSIRPNKPTPAEKKAKPSKWRLDEQMSWYGLSMMGVGYALIIGIVIFALWIFGAANEGATSYRRLVCQVKRAPVLPNTIKLANGTSFEAMSINHSDNYSFVVNKDGLSVVSVKKEPIVIEVVKLPDVDCENEFPQKNKKD